MAHLSLLSRLQAHQRRAWLYQVSRNRFLDEQRARRRERALMESLGLDMQLVGTPTWAAALGWLDGISERYR